MPGTVASTAEVLSVSVHPRLISPTSPMLVSATKSFHSPLGFTPLKMSRLTGYGNSGAGAGRLVFEVVAAGRLTTSGHEEPTGIGFAACWSKIHVKLSMSSPPQLAVISAAFLPLGATSSSLRSAGWVWLTPLRVTLTSLTGPATPPTVTKEGYGDPGPEVALPGIAIGVVLGNDWAADAGTAPSNRAASAATTIRMSRLILGPATAVMTVFSSRRGCDAASLRCRGWRNPARSLSG